MTVSITRSHGAKCVRGLTNALIDLIIVLIIIASLPGFAFTHDSSGWWNWITKVKTALETRVTFIMLGR